MDEETSIFNIPEPNINTGTQTILSPQAQQLTTPIIDEIISIETMFNTETYDKAVQELN